MAEHSSSSTPSPTLSMFGLCDLSTLGVCAFNDVEHHSMGFCGAGVLLNSGSLPGFTWGTSPHSVSWDVSRRLAGNFPGLPLFVSLPQKSLSCITCCPLENGGFLYFCVLLTSGGVGRPPHPRYSIFSIDTLLMLIWLRKFLSVFVIPQDFCSMQHKLAKMRLC